MKKIVIIGDIIRDTYVKKGKSKHCYGGILYITSVLSIFFNKKAEIIPLALLNKDHYTKVVKILKKYKNVDTAFIKKIKDAINSFIMYFDKDNKYYNYQCHLNNKSITYSVIEPHLDADIIVVSYITGNDIELSTLKKIADKSNSTIFGDIHHVIYNPPENGIKIFKTMNFWEDWINCFDIIQGTTFEWEYLLKGSPLFKYVENLVQYPQKEIKKRFLKAAEKIINKYRPKVLLLTDGKYGAFVFYKKGKKLEAFYKPAIDLRKIKDTTGCGDTFSGSFLSKYINTGNVKKSLKYAVKISSLKTQFLGLWTLKQYDKIKKKVL